MKKKIVLVMTLVLSLALCACLKTVNSNDAQTSQALRTVQYCYGYDVELPQEMKSISTNYQSATQIMLML